MSLFCDYEGGDYEWYYESAYDFQPLDTKYSRKCCSCKKKIKPGEDSLKFLRCRSPQTNFEEAFYQGDDVPLTTWYMCEECGGLYLSISELGLCHFLGGNIKNDIREWNAENAPRARS